MSSLVILLAASLMVASGSIVTSGVVMISLPLMVSGLRFLAMTLMTKSRSVMMPIDFPALLVLGAGEEFEDELGDSTASKMTLRITGYIKDVDTPEESLCNLIQDVLKCIDNDTYNPYKKGMRPLNIETDEGMIHDLASGIAMFILSIEIFYVFKRNNP